MSADDVIDRLWERSGHGTTRADVVAAYEAGMASVHCPCGAPYVKVEGGYVPSCACAADHLVTVKP